MNTFWVLTCAYNDYDQHGDYFVAAWLNKPTSDQLKLHVLDWWCGPDVDPVPILLEKGGGRQGSEDKWYDLALVNEGAQ